MDVTIVLPECSNDDISEGLRTITKAIHDKKLAHEVYGVLGGEFGYGRDFENEVFKMHPYCWCDSEDCKWCGDENAPHFLHKASGSTVHWYKYIGRGMECKLTKGWPEIEKECLASMTTTGSESDESVCKK